MAENFPKLMMETKPRIQEVQRTPSRINSKKIYTKAHRIQLQKVKHENIFKEPEGEKTL